MFPASMLKEVMGVCLKEQWENPGSIKDVEAPPAHPPPVLKNGVFLGMSPETDIGKQLCFPLPGVWLLVRSWEWSPNHHEHLAFLEASIPRESAEMEYRRIFNLKRVHFYN